MPTDTLTDASLRAQKLRLMIFDVDGILTDGGLRYGAEGELIKTFNVLDGQGIKLLQQSGVAAAIISARQSAIVARRASDLGIKVLMQGVHGPSLPRWKSRLTARLGRKNPAKAGLLFCSWTR